MSDNRKTASSSIPWWKEPTKDQWHAYIAAWLGWTLDAFDFTVFLVLIVPIANEFHAPLTWVALVGTLTLWMRLLGAVASGWMADRMGRKSAADDLYPVVLDLQFHRRLLADLYVSAVVPHAAGNWHGRGVASRRRSGNGNLADPVPRTDVGGAAELLGDSAI